MIKDTRILLAGGGTAGHIYPLLAIAKYLKGHRLRYFGDPGMHKEALKENGIEISAIISAKLRRYFSLLNVLDIFKLFFSFLESLWKVYWFMPDVVFSKGGPGTLPIILASRFYFIPVIIHESDAIPGLANRIAARYAKKIELAFESAGPYFKAKGDVKVTGQPVREEILKSEPKEDAKRSFGFDSAKPAMLVLGGSQGSSRINDFILANIELLLSKFQILHQVGVNNYDEYKNEYDFVSKSISPILKKNYIFTSYFSDNLAAAYNAADLVISRAGAGAIFEIAAKSKPAILIPLPESANGHQEANAYEYQKISKAIIIEQENLLPNLFLNIAEELFQDRNRLEDMAAAANNFYKPDAAKIIAGDIESLIL